VKIVARFDPPDAQAAAREWREQHAAAFSAIPDDAVQIDVGRAVGGGDFVQIKIAESAPVLSVTTKLRVYLRTLAQVTPAPPEP
jgi:hypothetical protein